MADAPVFHTPALAANLGHLVWSPPVSLIDRALSARRRRVKQGILTLGGAVVALGIAAASVGATPEVAGGFAGIGVLLLLLSFWVWRSATAAGEVCLAVFKGGVLLPSSFSNVPGIETFSGPRAIPLTEVARAEELRRPEGRAVLVWMQGGTGAIVSERVGEVRLSHEEQESVLDEFIQALGGVGIKVRTPDDPVEADPVEAGELTAETR
jgi:hypothetical protein